MVKAVDCDGSWVNYEHNPVSLTVTKVSTNQRVARTMAKARLLAEVRAYQIFVKNSFECKCHDSRKSVKSNSGRIRIAFKLEYTIPARRRPRRPKKYIVSATKKNIKFKIRCRGRGKG